MMKTEYDGNVGFLQRNSVEHEEHKYSVSDFLNYLKYIRRAKINNVWYIGEITKSTQTLLDKLDIHIT